ncbi:hypothetical protein KSB_42270 [Ktedonobacter robiniae]|uniref:Uncharacterized protein n=1 Tax=Ktedonobacter robiniae TaxID=2778365 RepID=A0ABQ3UTP5_9CHLR|nr:hypothetical protein KSB_42270 [Ktedonobacter robiniae]
MPDIRLQAIESQDHLPLFLQSGFDPLLIGDTQSDQFFIAMHQIGHAALSDTHSACLERLVDFRDRAMFSKAPLTDQGDDLQTKFPMR